MTAPRWRKTVSDITTRPGRSALAVLAMVVGIAVLGTLAFSYSLLRPVLASMYGGTQPASAVFYTNAVNDDLVEAVREGRLFRQVGALDAQTRRGATTPSMAWWSGALAPATCRSSRT